MASSSRPPRRRSCASPSVDSTAGNKGLACSVLVTMNTPGVRWRACVRPPWNRQDLPPVGNSCTRAPLPDVPIRFFWHARATSISRARHCPTPFYLHEAIASSAVQPHWFAVKFASRRAQGPHTSNRIDYVGRLHPASLENMPLKFNSALVREKQLDVLAQALVSRRTPHPLNCRPNLLHSKTDTSSSSPATR